MLEPIVIAIPTYRRPDLLFRLLDSLAPELAGRGDVAAVVIADNDCSAELRAQLAAYSFAVPLHHYQVPERGLCNVRNTLVRGALEVEPGWQWLVMLDDDGIVTPGWLTALLACGREHGAELIGGPVDGGVPPEAGILARVSKFGTRREQPSGPTDRLYTTQNLAITRRVLDMLGLPLFDMRFNASGGEDYDLFRRTQRAGGSLAWCDEALVLEPTPPERLTPRALLSRYYTTGMYMAALGVIHDGARHTWIDAFRGLAASGARLGIAAATFNRPLAAQSALYGAYTVGRLAGLVGRQGSRYIT